MSDQVATITLYVYAKGDKKWKLIREAGIKIPPFNEGVFSMGREALGVIEKDTVNIDLRNFDNFTPALEARFIIPKNAEGLLDAGNLSIGVVYENKVSIYIYDKSEKRWKLSSENGFTIPE